VACCLLAKQEIKMVIAEPKEVNLYAATITTIIAFKINYAIIIINNLFGYK